jgi:hypothetical protein
MRPTDYLSHATGILNPLKESHGGWGGHCSKFVTVSVVVFTFSPLAYVNQPKALFDSDMYRVVITASIRVKRLSIGLEQEGVELWDLFPWPGWSLGYR